jgi:bifunctional oligoribonuclease and PAP phosphatase NrnA
MSFNFRVWYRPRLVNIRRFEKELAEIVKILGVSKRVLITAPGTADGDSIGAQLALRKMLLTAFPHLEVRVVNDEPLPERYHFLPDSEEALTPECCDAEKISQKFDVGFIVDGGIDRAGRVREIFEACSTKVFIDHHAVSYDYPYTIRIVEPTASATTELMYHISQTPLFHTPVDRNFSQQIYLGLIFDTGFFRHSNTTAEVMELGAKLLRTGFDFTKVGERGMLERSFSSLKLMSDTLSQSQLRAEGKIIWSALTQEKLQEYNAIEDDREGIIDHLFLTRGTEVAVLFFEQPGNRTKISFRSQGRMDVAKFARSLTVQGGGHQKAAGAILLTKMSDCVEEVLRRLEEELKKI